MLYAIHDLCTPFSRDVSFRKPEFCIGPLFYLCHGELRIVHMVKLWFLSYWCLFLRFLQITAQIFMPRHTLWHILCKDVWGLHVAHRSHQINDEANSACLPLPRDFSYPYPSPSFISLPSLPLSPFLSFFLLFYFLFSFQFLNLNPIN